MIVSNRVAGRRGAVEPRQLSLGVGDEVLADVARALSAARRERGLRQADVAARMGTSQSCISDFERGKANPQLSFVARYAAVVGATIRVESRAARGAGAES